MLYHKVMEKPLQLVSDGSRRFLSSLLTFAVKTTFPFMWITPRISNVGFE